LALCDFIPDLLNKGTEPTRNLDCKMKMLKFNNLYALCFLCPSALGNFFFLIGYRWHLFKGSHPLVINDYLKKGLTTLLISAAILTMIGYTTWFILAMKNWKLNSSACTQGWNQLDMLNFMFLTAFTGWPATVTIVFVTISILCSPCIVVSLQDYWANLRQRAEEQHDIINTVVRTHWDPEVFKALDDCAIC
jgi:hypothetical protein